jgi:hypothetical protein
MIGLVTMVALAALGQEGGETLRQRFFREMKDPELRRQYVEYRQGYSKIVDDPNPPEVPKDLRFEQAWQGGSRCGPVALYFLLKLHGLNVSLEQMIEAVPVSAEGASLAQLQTVAERFGLRTQAVKFTPEDMPKLPTPYIVHYNNAGTNDSRDNHFDVVFKSFGSTRCGFIDTTNCITKTGDYEAMVGRVSGYALIPVAQGAWWRTALWWAFGAVLALDCVMLAVLGLRLRKSPAAAKAEVARA